MVIERLDPAFRAIIEPSWRQVDVPLHTLPVPEIREKLNRLRKGMAKAAAPHRPNGLVAEDRTMSLAGRDLPIRVYRKPASGPRPAIVFYHGGGFCIGDLDTHDRLAASLSDAADAVVVSVGYRLAPEAPFPAAVDDAWESLRRVAGDPADFGADPDRLAVAGDSAGGNLATVAALLARDAGGPALRHQLLHYPTVDLDFDRPSFREFGAFNPMLTVDLARHYMAAYHGGDLATKDPRAVPLHAPSLAGLPPATVVIAELDLLADEGEAYARKLAADGVAVERQFVPNLIHGFLRALGTVDSVDAAFAKSVAPLRAALHG